MHTGRSAVGTSAVCPNVRTDDGNIMHHFGLLLPGDPFVGTDLRREYWVCMDRVTIEQHLAEAERHIEQGAAVLERQQTVIAQLEHDGHDTTLARELLSQFEQIQSVHIIDRDRLTRELVAL